MKKILVAFMTGCMAIGMISCSDNSPRGVAEQGAKCLKNKDFKGYVDLLQDFDGKSKEDKEFYARMIEINAKGEIESYNIIDEQVDEKAGRARITFEIVLSNGFKGENTINLVKNDRGKWRIE